MKYIPIIVAALLTFTPVSDTATGTATKYEYEVPYVTEVTEETGTTPSVSFADSSPAEQGSLAGGASSSPTETEEETETAEETEAPTETEPAQTCGGYSDADINRITTVVNGEIGGICGSIIITYADGSQASVGCETIRMMHARVVVNQVNSSLFPNTVSGCVSQCFAKYYNNPNWQSSSQWQSCRKAVVNALNGGVYIPSNVFAATCDPYFSSKHPGNHLYARVDWNTGWVSGTFYYYAYGY